MLLAGEHRNWGYKSLRANSNQLKQAIRRAVPSMEVSVPLRSLKLQREAEQNAQNFNTPHKGKWELKFPFKSAGTFRFNFGFRNACTLNPFFFKNKFEISYFNSRRMQFPGQLPGLGTEASVLNNELALSPLKEAKARWTSSALPQHPCLHGAEPSTSCLLQQVGSGSWRRHKPPLSFSPLASLAELGGDFEPDPELMDLARIPRCWRRGWRVFQPLSLSDGNRATNLRIAQKGIKWLQEGQRCRELPDWLSLEVGWQRVFFTPKRRQPFG